MVGSIILQIWWRRHGRSRLGTGVFRSSVPTRAEEKPEKNPAAVALGRLGGLKGGKARAEKLSAKKPQRDRPQGSGGAMGKGRQKHLTDTALHMISFMIS
jgi:hypothetical protein